MTQNKKNMKKEMSEGQAITVVVLGLTVGGILAYYLLTWLIGLFFPDLIR